MYKNTDNKDKNRKQKIRKYNEETTEEQEQTNTNIM